MKKMRLTNNNFIKCGLTGLILEIIWTGFLSFRRREMKLLCKTSIWMFPIYGLASLIKPLYHNLAHFNCIIRGFIYTLSIFMMELTTGLLLKKYHSCPWDYSNARHNFKGVIRLDYAPLWFFCGLIFEKIQCHPSKHPN